MSFSECFSPRVLSPPVARSFHWTFYYKPVHGEDIRLNDIVLRLTAKTISH